MTPLEIYMRVILAEREASDEYYSKARKARQQKRKEMLEVLGLDEAGFAKIEAEARKELGDQEISRDGYRLKVETEAKHIVPASAKSFEQSTITCHKER